MLKINQKRLTVEKVQLPDGKTLIREKVIEIPKEEQWLLILSYMKKSGMVDKFKFVYGNEVMEKPMKFAYDHVNGGIGVRLPDKVLLVKIEKEGYWEEEKVIGEIDFRRRVDPTPEQSIMLIDLVRKL